jgi:hypothetical protein
MIFLAPSGLVRVLRSKVLYTLKVLLWKELQCLKAGVQLARRQVASESWGWEDGVRAGVWATESEEEGGQKVSILPSPQSQPQPREKCSVLWSLWLLGRAQGQSRQLGGGSSSVKRFCLSSCCPHTLPHLLSQERDFNNELLHDNRPLINSLLFFWGQITLIKVCVGEWGGDEQGLCGSVWFAMDGL